MGTEIPHTYHSNGADSPTTITGWLGLQNVWSESIEDLKMRCLMWNLLWICKMWEARVCRNVE